MTQRDEIFETLQAMTTGRAAYICTPSNVDNRFDLTKPSQLILASARCLAGANPFTDNLVRAPGLQGTGLYLNRVSSSVERFGNNFALTSTYRVNWSPRRNWSRDRDQIYEALGSLQTLSNTLQRTNQSGSRQQFEVDDDQRESLESILQTVIDRPRCDVPTDHYHVSYTLIGEITDMLRFSNRRDSYHYSFNYSYTFPYTNMVGYRNSEYSVKARLELPAPVVRMTENGHIVDEYHGHFVDAYFQLHMCGHEDIVVDEGETLNRVRLFRRQQPEEVYRDWLPKPETLSLAFGKTDGLSLFKRTDLEADVKPVKKLEDLIAGDMLNIPIKVEMFDTETNTSHKLEPGVYQFLLNEEPYFEGNMFQYGAASLAELSRYRVTFPTGKVTAITPSSEKQVVTRANISRRELSLPQDTEISHSHQINKNF